MVLIERNEKTQKRISKFLQKRGGSYFERGAKHSPISLQKVFYKRTNPFSPKNPEENVLVLDLFDGIFSKANLRQGKRS
jgi:hypothetical protein